MGEQLEHKVFAFKLDGPPDAGGHFTGYAAVFGNVDRGNDVIEAGATTKTIQENPDVPLFWVHNYGLVPIGTGKLTTDPEGKGVRLEGSLLLETSELAREVFGAMKAGAVKGLSVGYNTLRRSYKGAVRHLQEIAIGEVSLCPFPMNPLAEVDGLKAVTRLLAQGKDAESVDMTMWMINAGSDFMSMLVQGARYDVAEQVQAIIEGLAQDLFAAADDDETTDQAAMAEVMSAKQLEALQSSTAPASATRDDDEAAMSVKSDDLAAPDISTLRELVNTTVRSNVG